MFGTIFDANISLHRGTKFGPNKILNCTHLNRPFMYNAHFVLSCSFPWNKTVHILKVAFILSLRGVYASNLFSIFLFNLRQICLSLYIHIWVKHCPKCVCWIPGQKFAHIKFRIMETVRYYVCRRVFNCCFYCTYIVLRQILDK